MGIPVSIKGVPLNLYSSPPPGWVPSLRSQTPLIESIVVQKWTKRKMCRDDNIHRFVSRYDQLVVGSTEKLKQLSNAYVRLSSLCFYVIKLRRQKILLTKTTAI